MEHIASTDFSKAEMLSKAFATNSCLPDNFKVDTQRILQVGRDVNKILLLHKCSGDRIVRVQSLQDQHLDPDTLNQVIEASDKGECKDTFCPNNSFFSLNEIKSVRNDMKKGKGGIGLFNDHIRKVTGEGIDRGLQIMLNFYWMFSYIPKKWRASTLVPVFKGGDKVRWKPSHYRGISLIIE